MPINYTVIGGGYKQRGIFDMILAILCILITYVLGLWLAINNLKRDKSGEIEARRKYKKLKNARLKKFYGLDKEN